jgi:diaminopimelate decarboxylase
MNREVKVHHYPGGFPARGDDLMIAGRSARDWISTHGSPLFLYDLDLVTARVETLRGQMPESIKIHYAMKANPHPEVVAHLAVLGDGIDVASAGEMAVAIASGARDISFAGPGKTDAELSAALAAGVTISLESEGEAARLSALASMAGKRAAVAIRINPDFDLKGAGMRMGGRPQPFGIDEERVPALLAALPAMALDFQGFHVYLGSQSLSAEGLVAAQTATLDLLAGLLPQCPARPRFLNIGGGFGVPYFPGDQPLDVGAVGTALAETLDRHAAALAGIDIILELGRYLVAEAGVYLTTVVDRKSSRGEIFLVTDGGLHHQLAASGNFGQIVRRNYPLAVATRMACETREVVTVAGCLCTPLDRLGERQWLAPAAPGDIIAIFQAGAYGLTASPFLFLGHEKPAEVAICRKKLC